MHRLVAERLLPEWFAIEGGAGCALRAKVNIDPPVPHQWRRAGMAVLLVHLDRAVLFKERCGKLNVAIGDVHADKLEVMRLVVTFLRNCGCQEDLIANDYGG